MITSTDAPKITIRRTGDKIAFFHEETEVACLFDHHDHIIFDPAIGMSSEIMGLPPVNYPQRFAELGLDVETARKIDWAPVPDAKP